MRLTLPTAGLLAALALAAAGCSSEDDTAGTAAARSALPTTAATSAAASLAPSPAATDVPKITLDSVKVGDCALAVGETDEAVDGIPVVPCDQEHQAEVQALVELPDGAFPGEAEISALAEQRCAEGFEAYVGVDFQESKYDGAVLNPTAQTWAEGDRTILCLVTAPDGQTLTGSVKDAKQ